MRRWLHGGAGIAAACVVGAWSGAAAADDDDAPPDTEEPAPPPPPPVRPPEVDEPLPPSPPAFALPPPPPVPPPAKKSDYRLGLFEAVFQNALDTVTGYNLLWHGAGIASTVALSASGADDEVQRWFWRDNSIVGGTISDVAFIGGWFTPAVIPAAIAVTGLAAGKSEHASGGVAALQAVGINAVFIQLLKFATGRPLPYEDGVPGDDSIKRGGDGREWFSFGGKGLNFGGVAWPSGHTSSHFALASSLVSFYRNEKWLPFVAYPIAALMGLAMVEGDHHWVSDVVAGGLSGHAIGWTVGSNMRRIYDTKNGKPVEKASSVQIRPLVTRDTMMFVLSFDPYSIF